MKMFPRPKGLKGGSLLVKGYCGVVVCSLSSLQTRWQDLCHILLGRQSLGKSDSRRGTRLHF